MAKSKKLIRSAVFLLCLATLASNQSQTASATQFVTLSGQINVTQGDLVNIIQAVLVDDSGVIAKVPNPQAGQPFTLQVPSDLPFIFNIWQSSGTSSTSWTTRITLTKDTNLSITLPTAVYLQGSVVDSEGNPIPVPASVNWADVGCQTRGGEMKFTDSAANVWSGGRGCANQSTTNGTFKLYGFPSGEKQQIKVQTEGNRIVWLSSLFQLSTNAQILICLNTSGVSIYKPVSGACMTSSVDEAIKVAADKVAADKVAADKVAADKVATLNKEMNETFIALTNNLNKYKIDISELFRDYPAYFNQAPELRSSLLRAIDYKIPTAASQSGIDAIRELIGGGSGSALASDFLLAQAGIKKYVVLENIKAKTAKKSTITCVKGKLTKKVTALKPKCPSGYKKK